MLPKGQIKLFGVQCSVKYEIIVIVFIIGFIAYFLLRIMVLRFLVIL